MQPHADRIETTDDAADLAAALCHELHLPIGRLLDSLERLHQTLRQRPRATADQPTLQLLRHLADAQTNAHHLSRVVAELDGRARVEPGRGRRLDVRTAVRAAAAVVTPADGDIAVDAPTPAWVDGVDTRLVHVFAELFTEALAEASVVIARVTLDGGGDVVVELRCAASRPRPLRTSTHPRERALGRAVVRHIVSAHGGRIDSWPAAADGVVARVSLPAASPTVGVTTQ